MTTAEMQRWADRPARQDPPCPAGTGFCQGRYPRLTAIVLSVGLTVWGSVRAARGESAGDYLAAGFRSSLITTIPGTFSGCAKDKSYDLADGSSFACSGTQRALVVQPKVQLLVSADGTVNVLLIGGRAYAGGLRLFRAGLRGSPISTSTDVLGAAATTPTSMSIAEVHAVEAIGPIVALGNIEQRRLDAMQNTVNTTGNHSTPDRSGDTPGAAAQPGARAD